jgi:AsmA protein
MLSVIVTIVLIVALIIGGLMLLPLFIDQQAIIDLAAELVKQQAGGELSVFGETDLSLIPTARLRLGDARLTLPQQQEGSSSLEARIDYLDVGLEILPLLAGDTEFHGLKLSGVSIDLTAPETATHTAGVETLTDQAWAQRGARERAERQQTKAARQSDAIQRDIHLSLGDVHLEDIRVLRRTPQGNISQSWQLDRLSITDFNTEGDTFDIAAQLRVDETQLIQSEGSFTLDNQLSQLIIESLDLSISTLDLDTTIHSEGVFAFDSLSGDIDVRITLPQGEISAQIHAALLDSPQLLVDLTSPSLAFTSGEGLNTPATSTTSATDESPADDSTALFDALAPLRTLDAQMTAEIATLSWDTQTLNDLVISATTQDGVLEISTVQGVWHAGRLDATASLNLRQPNLRLISQGALTDTELGGLTSSFGGRAAEGTATLNWSLTTSGHHARTWLAQLSGTADVAGDQVVVNAISVDKLICGSIARLNKTELTADFAPETPVSKLSVTANFNDGIATIHPLNIASPGVALGGRGTLDLKSLTLQARLKGQLQPALSELDPACTVEERFTAIDWPLECAGTIGAGAPRCRIDGEDVAKQLLRYEAQSALERKAGKLGRDAGNLLNNLLQRR